MAVSTSTRVISALEHIKPLAFSCKTLMKQLSTHRNAEEEIGVPLSRTVTVSKSSEMLKVLGGGEGRGEDVKILECSETFSLRVSYSRSGSP